jgi:hypothetical protein
MGPVGRPAGTVGRGRERELAPASSGTPYLVSLGKRADWFPMRIRASVAIRVTRSRAREERRGRGGGWWAECPMRDHRAQQRRAIRSLRWTGGSRQTLAVCPLPGRATGFHPSSHRRDRSHGRLPARAPRCYPFQGRAWSNAFCPRTAGPRRASPGRQRPDGFGELGGGVPPDGADFGAASRLKMLVS